jgi:hypothetical protein
MFRWYVKFASEPVRPGKQGRWEAAARVNLSRESVPLAGDAAGSLRLRWP